MYNFLEKNLGSQPILHSFSQLSDIADSKLWEKKKLWIHVKVTDN